METVKDTVESEQCEVTLLTEDVHFQVHHEPYAFILGFIYL